MLRWIGRRLAMVQVVVCAIIYHITQQSTSKQAGSHRWCCKHLNQVPELQIAQINNHLANQFLWTFIFKYPKEEIHWGIWSCYWHHTVQAQQNHQTFGTLSLIFYYLLVFKECLYELYYADGNCFNETRRRPSKNRHCYELARKTH